MNASSFAVSDLLFSPRQLRLAGFCIAAFLTSLVGGCTDKRDVDNSGRSGAANQSSNQSNEHEIEGDGEHEGEGMGMHDGRGHATEGRDSMRRGGRTHSGGMGMMDKEKRR